MEITFANLKAIEGGLVELGWTITHSDDLELAVEKPRDGYPNQVRVIFVHLRDKKPGLFPDGIILYEH